MLSWLKERWLDVRIRWHVIPDKLAFWIVWLLPRKLIEIATVRCWANATTGRYGTEHAGDVTVDVALRRWTALGNAPGKGRAPDGLVVTFTGFDVLQPVERNEDDVDG